jgi:hypothetical protein
MRTLQPSPFITDRFWSVFRKSAHMLIALGYRKAAPRIKSTVDEESVTGFLYEAIREIIRFGNEKWCKRYEVLNESPLPSEIKSGKSRRRTDLIILHVFNQTRPEFVIEAKPLNCNKPYQCEDNYLNAKALQRFIRGEYAEYTSIYPEVAMLGYTFTNTPEEWRDKLKIAIDSKRAELRLVGPQIDVQIIKELPVEWKTEHDRETASSNVVIYHILLDCYFAGVTTV